VLSDRVQLELALMNLAVNARDAMPEGGTIVLSADVVEDEHGRAFVRLAVDDDGTGMDPETLSHATDPFFTTKGVGKGTGLGLPMVQGMVEQCGGRFVLASELGKGTRAEVWLPVTEAARQPERPRTPQPRPAAADPRGRRRSDRAAQHRHDARRHRPRGDPGAFGPAALAQLAEHRSTCC
jgi:hypothetical protein